MTLDGHPPLDPRGEGYVNDVAISPDDRFILTAGTGGVKIWDANDGSELALIPVGSPIEFLPDGGQFIASKYVWEIDTRDKVLTLQSSKESGVVSYDMSADGRFFVGGSYFNQPTIWDLQTGEIVYSLPSDMDGVAGLDFSPDGSLLLISHRDGTARIWDVDKKKQLALFKSDSDSDIPRPVRFHPSGKQFLTVGENATAHLWNLADFVETTSQVPDYDELR